MASDELSISSPWAPTKGAFKISNAEGPNASFINGVFEPTGDIINDAPVFKMKGGERFAFYQRMWRVGAKMAKNGQAGCAQGDSAVDKLPQEARDWRVLMAAGKWEAQRLKVEATDKPVVPPEILECEEAIKDIRRSGRPVPSSKIDELRRMKVAHARGILSRERRAETIVDRRALGAVPAVTDAEVVEAVAILEAPHRERSGSHMEALPSSIMPLLPKDAKSKDIEAYVKVFEQLMTLQLGIEHITKFMEKEFSDENMLFWKEAEWYSVCDQSRIQQLEHLVNINNHYIKQGAAVQVNVPDEARVKVQEIIDGGGNKNTSLQECSNEIFHLMKIDTFPRFVKSTFFQALCAELNGTKNYERYVPMDYGTFSDPDASIGGYGW